MSKYHITMKQPQDRINEKIEANNFWKTEICVLNALRLMVLYEQIRRPQNEQSEKNVRSPHLQKTFPAAIVQFVLKCFFTLYHCHHMLSSFGHFFFLVFISKTIQITHTIAVCWGQMSDWNKNVQVFLHRSLLLVALFLQFDLFFSFNSSKNTTLWFFSCFYLQMSLFCWL